MAVCVCVCVRHLYILRMVRKCKGKKSHNQQKYTWLNSIGLITQTKVHKIQRGRKKTFRSFYSFVSIFFFFLLTEKLLRQMRNNGSFIWGWRLSREISTR